MSPARVIALTLTMTGIASGAGAQMLVTRNVVVAPVMAKDSAERFPSPRFFIEASRGYGSLQDNQAWNIKMGGMFQVSPWGGRSVLVGLFAHELTSNPYNTLGYNPRGALWDENALFVQRRKAFDRHSGLFFRCRHEIDSALPTDERIPDSLHVPTSRLLGLAGVQAGITTHELALTPRLRWRGYVRAEGYFHNKDDRAPNLPGGPDWRDALAAGTIGGRVSFAPRLGARLYGRAWMTTMTFQGTRTDGLRAASNGRAEVGVRGWGTPGGADLYTAYEYFFDDLASPLPQTSKVISVGLRVTSSEFF
jgi:hypothetical protein